MPYPQFTTGTFTSATQSPAFSPKPDVTGLARFNIAVWGTFVGTVALQQSFDAGVTWIPSTYPDGTAFSFTGPVATNASEFEEAVLYRLACTAYTSGTINWRLSQ